MKHLRKVQAISVQGRLCSMAACGVAMLVAPTTALALSCLRPDPALSFNRAANAAEFYVVVHGAFDFDPNLLPNRMGDTGFAANDVTEVPAHFSGHALGLDGFTVPVEREVALWVECLGPWCGAATPDAPSLAFVEVIEDGYALTIGPCGGQMFDNPSVAVLDQMTTCLVAGQCPVTP